MRRVLCGPQGSTKVRGNTLFRAENDGSRVVFEVRAVLCTHSTAAIVALPVSLPCPPFPQLAAGTKISEYAVSSEAAYEAWAAALIGQGVTLITTRGEGDTATAAEAPPEVRSLLPLHPHHSRVLLCVGMSPGVPPRPSR